MGTRSTHDEDDDADDGDDGDEGDEGGGSSRPTRAERRRHGEDSAALARRLLSLSDEAVRELPLPDAVRAEVDELRRIRSPAARRRQERKLAQVLRAADLTLIAQMLDEQRERRAQDARGFQRIEEWRERLIDGDAGALEELAAAHPAADAAALRALADDARSERSSGRPRGASRKLFRALRDVLESGA